MKRVMIMAACAALAAGCSVTKIEYHQNEKGETSYRIYRNGHWLKTEAEGMSGGMSADGKFSIALDGMRSSPSEEFNRTMQTYTGAFIQLAQIAAAAYNPSSSAAASGRIASAAGNSGVPETQTSQTPKLQDAKSAADSPATQTSQSAAKASAAAAVTCADGKCEDTTPAVNICTGEPLAGAACADGKCEDK